MMMIIIIITDSKQGTSDHNLMKYPRPKKKNNNKKQTNKQKPNKQAKTV